MHVILISIYKKRKLFKKFSLLSYVDSTISSIWYPEKSFAFALNFLNSSCQARKREEKEKGSCSSPTSCMQVSVIKCSLTSLTNEILELDSNYYFSQLNNVFYGPLPPPAAAMSALPVYWKPKIKSFSAVTTVKVAQSVVGEALGVQVARCAAVAIFYGTRTRCGRGLALQLWQLLPGHIKPRTARAAAAGKATRTTRAV